MLIGLDGNEANIRERVGSNIYAYQLLWSIYQLRITNYEFRVYLKCDPIDDLPKETVWWKYRVLRSAKFWTQWRLPLDLYFYRSRPDVFFTPGHYAPRWSPCPTIVSIMDLSYIYFPGMFKKRDLWQLNNWTAYSVKKAKKVLTISNFSKNAIIKHYHLKKDKIVVTYPGMKQNSQSVRLPVRFAESRRAGQATLSLKEKYSIKGDYILYVGTLQPRKNVVRLIDSFKKLKDTDKNLQLVVIGKKGWLFEEIFRKVRELGLEDDVIFTDYVPEKELPAFYQNAQCFVLVSLYEGFGLPILEAMKYGCPVVASNVSSLPEVVGKAGILVDPKNIDNITAGIKTAIENREKLIRAGFKQAKKFSWQKCAKETLEVLEDVAKNC